MIPFGTSIGCVDGLVYAIRGKPKGVKMLGLAIAMGVFWNLIGAMLRSVNKVGRQ